MSGQTQPFTVEQFYKHVLEGKLLGAKCRRCGKVHLPPRPLCNECFSKEFDWVELPPYGTLLTYTVIHVAPPQFQAMAPYTVGIATSCWLGADDTRGEEVSRRGTPAVTEAQGSPWCP